MLTLITLKKDTERVIRDASIPLTRVTFLCGPNGSGKSTVIDAIDEFINRVPRDGGWTAEKAPIQIEGSAQAVLIYSMEKDNPRTLAGYDAPAAMVVRKIWAVERSHGQSNYSTLEDVFQMPDFDVMVLDEPESALDLDGLLWLRIMLMSTDKQVILATHSPVLLSLLGSPNVSVQNFGEINYDQRLLASFSAACSGKTIPAMKKRLKPVSEDSTCRTGGARRPKRTG